MQPKTNETTESASSTAVRVGVIGGLAIAVIVGLVLVAQVFASFAAGDDGWAVEPGQAIEVTISSGSSASSIYVLLHEEGVARSSDIESAARASGVEDRLQAGTYSFTTDMDPSLVVRRLVEGGDVTTGATFTVIEGWTIDHIIDELAEATSYTRAEFQKTLRDGNVSSPLLPTDVEDPLVRWEGLLYPAKYPIAPDATPREILQPMADEMTRRFEAIDWSSIGELGISRYEALVVGSLIEWEAAVDEDRGMISSVVHNRLDQGMRLQIDATVIYALGYNPKRVLAEHLKTVSPYNTYLVDGLPPTPIGAVSTASLEAAVHPIQSDYLFYVLGHEDGTHVFAVTYEQHQANVKAAKDAGILP